MYSPGYMSALEMYVGSAVFNTSVCVIPTWTGADLFSIKAMKALGVCHSPAVGLVSCDNAQIVERFLPLRYPG